MTWLRGVIVEFTGGKPEHSELRKVRTRPDQRWEEMYFFRLDLARSAGYPDSELADGKEIEFEPTPKGERPAVRGFKPYEGGAGAEPASDFLNPYHFIPLLPPPPGDLSDVERLLREGMLHDRFLATLPDSEDACYSGRVVCRLETEGPVVIGGRQSKPRPDRETLVEPFTLPGGGAAGSSEMRPAIPGSTLRGLISSLVEAASCSALRVLSEKAYTRRAAVVGEALSAIGMIEEGEAGGLKLRPLALSVAEMTRLAENERRHNRNRPRRHEGWRVLVNGYEYNRRSGVLAHQLESFLHRERPLSWSSSHRDVWYADLNRGRFHWRRGFCLGLDLDEAPIRHETWEQLPEATKGSYTCG
ncbi:MAG: hypothetical protein ACRD2T_06700, partial [Thermoanaerobaculia bacterium]